MAKTLLPPIGGKVSTGLSGTVYVGVSGIPQVVPDGDAKVLRANGWTDITGIGQVGNLVFPDNKHIGAPKYTDLVSFGDSICALVGIGTGVVDADMHMYQVQAWAPSQGITPRGTGVNGGTFPQYLRAALVTTPLTSSTIILGHSGFNVTTGTSGGRSPKLMRDMEKLTEAMLLWDAIPEANKVRIRDATTGNPNPVVGSTGTFGSYTSLATNFAQNSSGTGGTKTFTVSGTHCYFFYGRSGSNGGTFNISIDGGPAIAVNSTLAYTPGASAESGVFCMDVVKFENLVDTTHTITVTVTASANVFYAAAGLNPMTTVGPTVLIGSCLYTNTPGNIAVGSNTGAAAWFVEEQAITDQNIMTKKVVDRMRAQGYLVYYINNTADYNTETECGGDNIHPLPGLHGRVAQRYMGAIRYLNSLRTNVTA